MRNTALKHCICIAAEWLMQLVVLLYVVMLPFMLLAYGEFLTVWSTAVLGVLWCAGVFSLLFFESFD